MSKRLHVFLNYGFCNKLVCLIGSYYISKKYSLDLILYDLKGSHCGLSLDKVFNFPDNIQHIVEETELQDFCYTTDYFLKKGIDRTGIIPFNDDYDISFIEEMIDRLDDIFYHAPVMPKCISDIESYSLFFNEMPLNEDFISDIKCFLEKCDLTDRVGLTARTTDMGRSIGIYIDFLKNIEEDKIFASFETLEDEELFKNNFSDTISREKDYVIKIDDNLDWSPTWPSKNIERSEKSVRDAVIDLFLFSKTKNVYGLNDVLGYYASTFIGTAKILKEISVDQIYKF